MGETLCPIPLPKEHSPNFLGFEIVTDFQSAVQLARNLGIYCQRGKQPIRKLQK